MSFDVLYIHPSVFNIEYTVFEWRIHLYIWNVPLEVITHWRDVFHGRINHPTPIAFWGVVVDVQFLLSIVGHLFSGTTIIHVVGTVAHQWIYVII